VRRVRISDTLNDQIAAWAKRQPDGPSWSEAVRRLIELGFKHNQPGQVGPHKGASKAREMAGKELDRLSDASATEEERQSRKHRILKDPKEFREMRQDVRKRRRRPRSIPVSKLNASNDV
jgi:hypothetical protein